jgi:glycolate oxidase FAD binding subunit
MHTETPQTPQQLAEVLHTLATQHHSICLGNSPPPFDVSAEANISTCAMKKLLGYDPRDLTISVEAGMAFAELERILAEHRQMLPLDPAWRKDATVGGVLAANLSGPRRRLYGTARDMTIGMTFATLEGKLVQTGGNVVKNVAGLDMAKLMIGSFGTLAAIATVNFKVFPMPEGSRTFVAQFETAAEAFAERDRILKSVLQPAAIDVVNWPSGFRLLVRAHGNAAVLERFTRELDGLHIADVSVWDEVQEFPARPGNVVPTSMKLSEMANAMDQLRVPAVARAGSGVILAHYRDNAPAPGWHGDLAMMERVKQMFDPERLLNRGRLYGRI